MSDEWLLRALLESLERIEKYLQRLDQRFENVVTDKYKLDKTDPKSKTYEFFKAKYNEWAAKPQGLSLVEYLTEAVLAAGGTVGGGRD